MGNKPIAFLFSMLYSDYIVSTTPNYYGKIMASAFGKLSNPVIDFEDFDLWSKELTEESKPEESLTTPHDPLVLSCTLFRLSKQDFTYRSFSLMSISLTNFITEQDRLLAEEIRKDFSHKLVLFVMQVGPLSKYKTELNTFLTSCFKQADGSYITPAKYSGMIYKLPYFHEYNHAQLALFNDTTKKVDGPDSFDGPVTLWFMNKLDPRTKKSKNKIEYWFKDDKQNRVMLSLDKTNPLRDIFDDALTDMPLLVTGKFFKHSNYSVEYYVVGTGAKLSLCKH